MRGQIGFDTVWLDMEHGSVDQCELEALCMAAESGGALPTVRVPAADRHYVLSALEHGARFLVVPMVNDVPTAERIVEYGKFPPQGSRGFNTRSRGVGYGLVDCIASFQQANEKTHFFAQIETLAAVENAEAICRVDGLAGLFIGPGDLSASAGMVGQFDEPQLIDMVTRCVRVAREMGKHAAILISDGVLLDAAVAAGCDLAFCGGDFRQLIPAWRERMELVHSKTANSVEKERFVAFG